MKEHAHTKMDDAFAETRRHLEDSYKVVASEEVRHKDVAGEEVSNKAVAMVKHSHEAVTGEEILGAQETNPRSHLCDAGYSAVLPARWRLSSPWQRARACPSPAQGNYSRTAQLPPLRRTKG